MKVFNLSIVFLAIAGIITSCGQANSNRKQLTSDVDPQTAALISQTSSNSSFDSLMQSRQLTTPSSLGTSDQSIIMLAHMKSSNVYKGNIYYGTVLNPYKGEEITLQFEYHSDKMYSFVKINSSRGQIYESYQPSQTSQLSFNGRTLSLHSDSNCMMLNNPIDGYEAVICKQ